MQLLNEQFNFIYSGYNETQLKNNRLLQMRKREVLARIPEFAELDQIIAELSVNMTKAAFDGTTVDTERLKKEIQAITRKKNPCLLEMVILRTICIRFIHVKTVMIPDILAMKNAIVSKKRSSNIYTSSRIYKKYCKQKTSLIFL